MMEAEARLRGRLIVESGRRLATKIMANGVEVIIKDNKSAIIEGNGPNPTPSFIHGTIVTTLPPTTVSNQFHLMDNPHRPNTAIDHLLQSMARSATPELVTKTMMTTFTIYSTLLQNNTTVTRSHEETVANVITEQKFPGIQTTEIIYPSEILRSVTASDIPPEILHTLDTTYITSTLTTTYSFFNSFNDQNTPLVLTSREIVENTVSIPPYVSTVPTLSRHMETETYLSTFTFSKTLYDIDGPHVLSQYETLTQVVVTEILLPVTQIQPSTSLVKTSYTTFTTFFTSVQGTESIVTSTTSVTSNVVTVRPDSQSELSISSFLSNPSVTQLTLPSASESFDQSESATESHPDIIEEDIRFQPVMIYATKTFYTTTTFLTSILGEGNKTQIQSRTSVVSNVVTEAISTVVNEGYLLALQSSYIAEHGLETSQDHHTEAPSLTQYSELSIRTIEGTYVPDEPSVLYPHWPKGEDEGILDPIHVTQSTKHHSPVQVEELSSEIKHIIQGLVNSDTIIKPTRTMMGNIYSTSTVQDISHIPTPPLKVDHSSQIVKNVLQGSQNVPLGDIDTSGQNKKGSSISSDNKVTNEAAEVSTTQTSIVEKNNRNKETSMVYGYLRQPISEEHKVFNLLSGEEIEDSRQTPQTPDYYDEIKEENAFKEPLEEDEYQTPPSLEVTTEKILTTPAATNQKKDIIMENKTEASVSSSTTEQTLEALQQQILDEIPTGPTALGPSGSTERITFKFTSGGRPITLIDDEPETETKKPKLRPIKVSVPVKDYEDDVASEGGGNVYSLILPKPLSDSNSGGEGDTDTENDQENEESDEEVKDDEVKKGRRPPLESGVHGPSHTNLIISPPIPPPAPEISVSPAGNGINWKPLLNLGAVGLGGLGASALTKWSPFLSSMAGYLKSGLALPILARNDTHGHEPSFDRKRPYRGQGHIQMEESSIPRRPIVTHANEPNFRFENGGHSQSQNRPPLNMNVILTPVAPGGYESQPSSNIVRVVAGKPVQPHAHIHRLPQGWGNQGRFPFKPQESNEILPPSEEIQNHQIASEEIIRIRPPPPWPTSSHEIPGRPGIHHPTPSHKQQQHQINKEYRPNQNPNLLPIQEHKPMLKPGSGMTNKNIATSPRTAIFVKTNQEHQNSGNSQGISSRPTHASTQESKSPSLLRPTQNQQKIQPPQPTPTNPRPMPMPPRSTSQIAQEQRVRPGPPLTTNQRPGPIVNHETTNQNNLRVHPGSPVASQETKFRQRPMSHETGNAIRPANYEGFLQPPPPIQTPPPPPPPNIHQNSFNQNRNRQPWPHGGSLEFVPTNQRVPNTRVPSHENAGPFYGNHRPIHLAGEESQEIPGMRPFPTNQRPRIPQIMHEDENQNRVPIHSPWEEPGEFFLNMFKPGGHDNPFNPPPPPRQQSTILRESSSEEIRRPNGNPDYHVLNLPQTIMMPFPLNGGVEHNFPTVALSSEEILSGSIRGPPPHFHNRPGPPIHQNQGFGHRPHQQTNQNQGFELRPHEFIKQGSGENQHNGGIRLDITQNSHEFRRPPSHEIIHDQRPANQNHDFRKPIDHIQNNERQPFRPPNQINEGSNYNPEFGRPGIINPVPRPLPPPPPPQRFPNNGQGLYEIKPESNAHPPQILLPGSQTFPPNPPPTLNTGILLPAWNSQEQPIRGGNPHHHQSRPSTVYIVEEIHNPPPRDEINTTPNSQSHESSSFETSSLTPHSSTTSQSKLPSTQHQMIIKEVRTTEQPPTISSSTTPKFRQSASSTTRRPMFIRRFSTTTATSTSTTPHPTTPEQETQSFKFGLFPQGFQFSSTLSQVLNKVTQKPILSSTTSRKESAEEQFGQSMNIPIQSPPPPDHPPSKATQTESSEEKMTFSEEEALIKAFTPNTGSLNPSTNLDELWWPTTFRPIPTHQNEIQPTTFRSQLFPTTYRNSMFRPTTFRPRHPLLSNAPNQVQVKRPWYELDENEGLDQLKLKNIEIHKTPGWVKTSKEKVNPVFGLLANSEEEEEEQEEPENGIPSGLETNKNKFPNLNVHLETGYDDDDGSYDSYEVPPPGFPATRLTPPPPPPGPPPPTENQQQKKPDEQQENRPFIIRRPIPVPPPQPPRPGPFESFTNIFRRPNPGQWIHGHRQPFEENSKPQTGQGPPLQRIPIQPHGQRVQNQNNNQDDRFHIKVPGQGQREPNVSPHEQNNNQPIRAQNTNQRWPNPKPLPPSPPQREKGYPAGAGSEFQSRPRPPIILRRPPPPPPPPKDPLPAPQRPEFAPANNFHRIKPIPLNPAAEIATTTKSRPKPSNEEESDGFSSYGEENEVIGDKIKTEKRPEDLRPAADGDPYYESEEEEDEDEVHSGNNYGNRNVGGHITNQEHDEPKVELEPPPINSFKLNPNINLMDLPNNGPIRIRPRPNLLRPQENLFKPENIKPKPSFHILATVDDENKILGTNTIPAFLPSRTRIQPTRTRESGGSREETRKPLLIGSVETVDLNSQEHEQETTTLSIVKYTRGSVTIVANQKSSFITPTRTIINRPIITRTRTTTTTEEPLDIEESEEEITAPESDREPIRDRDPPEQPIRDRDPPEEPIRTQDASEKTIVSQENPIRDQSTSEHPVRVQDSSERPVKFGSSKEPIKGKDSHERPLKFGNSKESIRIPDSSESPTKDFTLKQPIRGWRPGKQSIRGQDSGSQSAEGPIRGQSSTEKTIKSKDSLERPKIKPPALYNPRKPFTPIRNPAESTVLPHWKQRKTTTTTPTPTTSQRTRWTFQNRFTKPTLSTKGTSLQTSPLPSEETSSPSSSTQETSSIENISEMIPTTFRPAVRPQFSTHSPRENLTATTLITKDGAVLAVVKKVTVSTASSVSTKLPMPKPTPSTRYVTHTETLTQTTTETQTRILPSISDEDFPVTETVILTKILPPETLISTIIGSVTLVNTLEIQPTTIRTTIFSTATQSLLDSATLKPSPETPRPILLTHRPTTPTPTSNQDEDRIITAGTGILIRKPRPPHPTSGELEEKFTTKSKQKPNFENACSRMNCSINGNQMCKENKCVCKPGYARMKSTFPCRPTFTYEMSIGLTPNKDSGFNTKDLLNQASEINKDFLGVTKEALESAFLNTDIRRQFQGAEVMKLKQKAEMVYVDFLVQLTTNMTEDRISKHLIRTLKNANFSIGKVGLLSPEASKDFNARDFNECLNPDYNDCSPNAECLNLRGSFTCACKEGYKDRSKRHRPGRECISLIGCAECNYKGNCYKDRFGNKACDCLRWYGGTNCNWNLKILLIGVIAVGSLLLCLILTCGIIVCRRKKGNRGRRERPGSGRFMRYRSPTSQATLERTAIMHDSGSSSTTGSDESHPQPMRSVNNTNTSYTPDSLVEGTRDNKNVRRNEASNLINFSLRNVVMEHDRSTMGVVIPRAKITRPSPTSRPSSGRGSGELQQQHRAGPLINDNEAERKLINYLELRGGSSNKPQQSSSQRETESKAFRKLSLQERRILSGALVSSGTEVSARGGMRRKSTGIEPEFPPRVYDKTLSDIRSSRASCYSCKPPSYCAYSESAGHTMAEKDGASTVYTVQGKLFRMTNDTDSNLSSD